MIINKIECSNALKENDVRICTWFHFDEIINIDDDISLDKKSYENIFIDESAWKTL